MILGEQFQRAHCHERTAIPRRPESNIGRLQAPDIQRMRASGCGMRSRARKMLSEQIDNPWIG
jgi:hypothetical protein